MDNITINIADYVSNERITELCEELIKEAVNHHLKDEGNMKRILSNAAYGTATRLVSEKLGEDADMLIAAEAVKVIGELSNFTVFRPSSYGEEASRGWTFLQQAITDNRHLIDERVKVLIGEFGKEAVKEVLVEFVRDATWNFESIANILEQKEGMS